MTESTLKYNYKELLHPLSDVDQINICVIRDTDYISLTSHKEYCLLPTSLYTIRVDIYSYICSERLS